MNFSTLYKNLMEKNDKEWLLQRYIDSFLKNYDSGSMDEFDNIEYYARKIVTTLDKKDVERIEFDQKAKDYLLNKWEYYQEQDIEKKQFKLYKTIETMGNLFRDIETLGSYSWNKEKKQEMSKYFDMYAKNIKKDYTTKDIENIIPKIQKSAYGANNKMKAVNYLKDMWDLLGESTATILNNFK